VEPSRRCWINQLASAIPLSPGTLILRPRSSGCRVREAVEDRHPDLDLRHLAVEFPGHQPLAEQLHAVHFRLDPAAPVVPAPVPPECPAQVLRCSQDLVACASSCRVRLSGPGVSTGWSEGMNAIGPSECPNAAAPRAAMAASPTWPVWTRPRPSWRRSWSSSGTPPNTESWAHISPKAYCSSGRRAPARRFSRAQWQARPA